MNKMTKEQLYAIWTLLPELKADLEAVIEHEVEARIKARDRMRKAIEPVKLPFDQDRFERMFCAVVASGLNARYEDDLEYTKEALTKLDAFYAKKKGGELTKEYLKQFDAYVGDKGGSNG